MKFNFDNITPCGEDCSKCKHTSSGECLGCRKTNGKCIKMWDNGCDIYKCCIEHNSLFCGLCSKFPCTWLIQKITSWNVNGIDNLKNLAEIYKKIIRKDT